jgi:hypothetical protein
VQVESEGKKFSSFKISIALRPKSRQSQIRLLKNAHLLRCAANRIAQRIVYTPHDTVFHLNVFEQPD